jgi:hypothetical protein
MQPCPHRQQVPYHATLFRAKSMQPRIRTTMLQITHAPTLHCFPIQPCAHVVMVITISAQLFLIMREVHNRRFFLGGGGFAVRTFALSNFHFIVVYRFLTV